MESTMMKKIRAAAKLLLPRSISIFYYRRQYKNYINNLEFDIDHSKKTILAINHFYDQDFEACQLSNKDFNFIIVDGPTLFKSAKEFFSSDVQKISSPYNSELELNINAWHNESQYIYQLILSKFHFDFVIMPSDSFYWIREFIAIAKKTL